jgi:hypothetical protein
LPLPVAIATDEDVVNAALTDIGEYSITAFDENTELADVCTSIYPRVVGECFAAYPFRWAIGTRQLERVTFTEADPQPANGYTYGFNFPADGAVGPHRVSLDRNHRTPPFRDFKVEGRRLFCDRETVFAEFTLRLPPAQWPDPFQAFVVKALAAALAVPCSHDTDLAQLLDAAAWGPSRSDRRGGLCGQAIKTDLHADPGFDAAGDGDVLTAAHYGGLPWSGE